MGTTHPVDFKKSLIHLNAAIEALTLAVKSLPGSMTQNQYLANVKFHQDEAGKYLDGTYTYQPRSK